MKLFHLGLCVAEHPNDGLRNGLLPICSEYRELNCGSRPGHGPNEMMAEALRICEEFRPDLVFMQIQSDGIITRGFVRTLQGMGCFVINWTGDCRNDIPAWMKHVEADVTAFSNMRDVRNMPGSEYLEIGYDPTIYTPDGEVTQIKPIAFFGNHYGTQFPMSEYRLQMVNFMKGCKDFGVYGNYPGADGNFNSSQKAEAAAYRSVKIAINCSHYEIERYSSDRLLRIMGTGVFCLCKAYPDMPFVDGVHLRTWNTVAELWQLCQYYMEHEEERNEIARQGWGFAREEYSYEAMGREILGIYNRRK